MELSQNEGKILTQDMIKHEKTNKLKHIIIFQSFLLYNNFKNHNCLNIFQSLFEILMFKF